MTLSIASLSQRAPLRIAMRWPQVRGALIKSPRYGHKQHHDGERSIPKIMANVANRPNRHLRPHVADFAHRDVIFGQERCPAAGPADIPLQRNVVKLSAWLQRSNWASGATKHIASDSSGKRLYLQ
jgi:hypothetical protein